MNVTCVQCENGKSISPIDSAQPTMAHDADTDSDLAPPDGKHPSARNATPARLLRSATRRRIAGHVVAHPGPSESEWGHRGAMDGSCSDDSEIEEERAAGGRRAGAGGPGADPGRRRLCGMLAEHSLIGWRRRHSACERTLHVWSTYAHGPLRPPGSGIDSFQVNRAMPLNCRFNQRIKGSATSYCRIQLWTQPTCVAASLRYPDLTACSSGNQDCKTISILAAA